MNDKLKARAPVGSPTQECSSHRNVVRRDGEQLSEDALPGPALRRGNDWRSMAVPPLRIGAPLDLYVRTMRSRRRGRVEFDVHESATWQRSAIQGLLTGHRRRLRLVAPQKDEQMSPR